MLLFKARMTMDLQFGVPVLLVLLPISEQKLQQQLQQATLLISCLLIVHFWCKPVSLFLIPISITDEVFSREEEEGILSSGPGIEREVIYAAYQQFESIPEQWFIPRADNLVTLATSHSMATARYVSAGRLSDLSVLGTIVALLLIHGITPGKLDPVVLQYFVYGCDIASIHPAFLREWHPEIHDTVARWIAVGPDGCIDFCRAHFASYHDISVSSNLNAGLVHLLTFVMGRLLCFVTEMTSLIRLLQARCFIKASSVLSFRIILRYRLL